MTVNMEKPYVVGMDIGGTNTVFGVVDSRGNVLASDSIKTQEHEEIDEYVDAVCKKLIPLLQQFGGAEKFKGMGVGAPNGNYYKGTIEFAPNLPWKGVIPLAAMFEDKLGIPTALTNDANAAAIGEMTYGAARGLRDFIMITLGTGVGSGIVVNGQLVYGHDGFAGELGHVVVERDGRLCGCGRKGVLKHTARLPVLHVLHANSWLHVQNQVYLEKFLQKKSYQRMFTMQLSKVTSLLWKYLNIQEQSWVEHWLILSRSQVRKQLFCLEVLPSQVILS